MDTKRILLEREPICILKKGFYDVKQAEYFWERGFIENLVMNQMVWFSSPWTM